MKEKKHNRRHSVAHIFHSVRREEERTNMFQASHPLRKLSDTSTQPRIYTIHIQYSLETEE